MIHDIKKTPYEYICNHFEHMYPGVGRKIFSVLSLVPISLIIPKIPSEVKNIKSRISLLWLAPPGCMPKGSKVLMSNGEWKNIEDLKEGDEIISPQDNGTNIFAKIKKVHNWESPLNYHVIEKKHNSILYRCSYNHKIPHYNTDHNPNINKIIKHTAEYLSKLSYCSLRRKRQFSTFPIIEFKGRKNCKIEPYCLGVYLGDGSFSSIRYKRKNYKGNKECLIRGYYKKGWGRSNKVPIVFVKEHTAKVGHIVDNGGICKQRKISITSGNQEIMNEVSKHYPIMNSFKGNNCKNYTFSYYSELSKLLTEYGLEGKGSGEKFIPKEALLSDINYRKRLLAGLIDTDGYYDREKGAYEITTKSEILAKDIKDLIFSLGCRANIRKSKFSIKSINFTGEYFRVSFNLRDMDLPILVSYKKLNSKREFWQNHFNTFTCILKEYGRDIVYGFEVDSPSHNFITDNWMVTGNSAKTSISEEVEKFALNPLYTRDITPARLIYEINKRENDKITLIVSDIATIFSNEELIKILEGILGEEAEISRNTMRNKEQETRKRILGVSYLSGTPKNISDQRIRDGIIGRTFPIITYLTKSEHDYIIDKVNSRMGNSIKEIDSDKIGNFYKELYSIQDGTSKEKNPIKGYIISEGIKSDIANFIKNLSFLNKIFENWGIPGIRTLEETYRIMVSHAFLNIFNHEVKDDKLVIEYRDLDVAKKLIRMEEYYSYIIYKSIENIDYYRIKTENDLRILMNKFRTKGVKVPESMKYVMKDIVEK